MPRVLQLVGSGQDIGIRGLDADEDEAEIGLGQAIDEIQALAQVDGSLREIPKRFSAFAVPGGERLADGLGPLGIADEIVVGKKDRAPVARGVDGLKFRQDVLHRLVAGHPAEEVDDIAEFASERTSARSLHGHAVVVGMLDEVVAGKGRHGQVRGGAAPNDLTGSAGFNRFQNQWQGLLAFAGHHEVASGRKRLFGGRGYIRSADHHRLAMPVRFGHAGEKSLALDEHGRNHDNIGKFPVLFGQRSDIEVNEAWCPVFGQQRGHGEQAKGR